MRASEVRTAEDARRIVEERDLSHVKVGAFDMDGVLRGKYMAREKFLSAMTGGFGFCDVVLGWDSYDQLYDNVQFTGWHTGYPDANVRILPESCREIPFCVRKIFAWRPEAASAACQGVTDETSAAKAVTTSARRGFTACS